MHVRALMRPAATAILLIVSALHCAPAANAQAQSSSLGASDHPSISDQKLDAAAAAIERVITLKQDYQQRMAAAPADQERILNEAVRALEQAVTVALPRVTGPWSAEMTSFKMGTWAKSEPQTYQSLLLIFFVAFAGPVDVRWCSGAVDFWVNSYGFFFGLAKNIATGNGITFGDSLHTAAHVPLYPTFLVAVTLGEKRFFHNC
jgi:hypothetical protein